MNHITSTSNREPSIPRRTTPTPASISRQAVASPREPRLVLPTTKDPDCSSTALHCNNDAAARCVPPQRRRRSRPPSLLCPEHRCPCCSALDASLLRRRPSQAQVVKPRAAGRRSSPRRRCRVPARSVPEDEQKRRHSHAFRPCRPRRPDQVARRQRQLRDGRCEAPRGCVCRLIHGRGQEHSRSRRQSRQQPPRRGHDGLLPGPGRGQVRDALQRSLRWSRVGLPHTFLFFSSPH